MVQPATRRPIQVPEDLRGVLTVPAAVAAKHVGLSQTGYYSALRAGHVPGKRIGHRVTVPVHELLEFLGITADDLDAA